MFEIRVLRRIFGPKRDKVTGEWKKLHNEEFNPAPVPWGQNDPSPNLTHVFV
jgi:hypothetical protein